MKKQKTLFYALFCIATMLSFTACNKDEEVSEPEQPDKLTPLCFTAEQDSAYVWFARTSNIPFPNLEYSRDLENWIPLTEDSSSTTFLHSMLIPKTGDKIYVRNQGKTNTFSISPEDHFQFFTDGYVSASGNLMSLIDKDCNTLEVPCDYAFYGLFAFCPELLSAPELPATTLTENCYNSMFLNCTALEKAPSVLPAKVLKPYCYELMFYNCEELQQTPTIAATTLAPYCFRHAFEGCISLTKVSALPATEMADYCYYRMFHGCSSLTTAPELPATTLANECYAGMFEQCSSLQKVPKVLPATTMKDKCYFLMFCECPNLENAPELPATELAYGCYYGMFAQCSKLQYVQESLPVKTLAQECYGFMYEECSSLTSLPTIEATTVAPGCCYAMFTNCTSATQCQSELPATVMENDCYAYMFASCQNLSTLPQLPATTLAASCYEYMFADCTAMRAPLLPATTLAPNCYSNMFNNCSNLNYMEVAFDQWPTESATTDWLDNVQTVGTFVCPSNLSDERGASRIPTGWLKTTSTNSKNVNAEKSSVRCPRPTGKGLVHRPIHQKTDAPSHDRNLFRVKGA